MNKQIIRIILALLFLGIAGAAVYFFFSRGDLVVSGTDLQVGEEMAEAPKGPPPPVVPEGWRKFENAQYSFSVYVPPELIVRPYDEGSGAHTFSFEDEKSARGFQIFVVPYHETTISPARFRKDVPSGVMKEPLDVVIGGSPEFGVTASAFFSEHSTMGETREVWFIYGNYLYEVTTYKEYDTWLAEIMNTWRFAQ